MSEFCTKCVVKIGDVNTKSEIDVFRIFENLEEGFVESGFICEGCGLIAISKIEGKLKVMKSNDENSNWEDYEL